MKAKTDLLLYRLMWLASKPLQPTYRNLTDSFEAWAYRNGCLQQIHRLEQAGLLESRMDEKTGQTLHRLTEAGMIVARGGRDPEACWNARWDGKWRLFLFDIPESESSARRRLRRALAAAGCGCLQASVWIAPNVPDELQKLVDGRDEDCSKLLLLHAGSKGRKADMAMVAAAWEFEKINRRYRKYLERFANPPRDVNRWSAEDLEQWTAAEAAAWKHALAADPLLPRALLPPGYLGCDAHAKRASRLAEVAELAHNMALPAWPASINPCPGRDKD